MREPGRVDPSRTSPQRNARQGEGQLEYFGYRIPETEYFFNHERPLVFRAGEIRYSVSGIRY